MPRRYQYQITTPNFRVPPPSFGWFQALSEPVRYPLRDVWYQPFTQNVFPIPQTMSWFEPLAEPQRQPLRDVFFQFRTDQNVFPITAVLPPLTWYSPWAEPQRRPRPAAIYDFAVTHNLAPITSPVAWLQPFSEPLRLWQRAAFPSLYGSFAVGSNIAPVPVAVPPMAWFSQLEVPRQSMQPAAFPSLFGSFSPPWPPGPPSPTGFYTVSGPDVKDLFTDLNDVQYNYSGRLSHRTK